MSKAGRWWTAELRHAPVSSPDMLGMTDTERAEDTREWLAAINVEMVAAMQKLTRDHWRRVYHTKDCPGCELPECEVGTNAHRARPR